MNTDSGMCVLGSVENPPYQENLASDYPIQVDEEQMTVTVDAGIPQRLLLDYLALYRYCLPEHLLSTHQHGTAVRSGRQALDLKSI